MSYYFLMASLPMLTPDNTAGMTRTRFLALCGEHLYDPDLAALKRLLAAHDDPSLLGRQAAHSAFERNWTLTETGIRNAIARERATRSGTDPSPYLRPSEKFDSIVRRATAEAFSRKNPREMELALDRLRWTALDELAGFDPFSADAVFSYGLKLAIAEKWAAMNTETGAAWIEDFVQSTSQPDRNNNG